MAQTDPAPPLANTRQTARRRLGGVSESTLRRLIAAGRLEVVKVGTLTLITERSLRQLLGLDADAA